VSSRFQGLVCFQTSPRPSPSPSSLPFRALLFGPGWRDVQPPLMRFAVVDADTDIAAESRSTAISPPDDVLPSVHSPCDIAASSSGIKAPTLTLPCRLRGFAPPCRFTPLTIGVTTDPWSCRLVASCCHLRVRRVSTVTMVVDAETSNTLHDFPATLFTPLEEFPSLTAARCHHRRCPLAVPSSSVSIHIRVSVSRTTLPNRLCGDCRLRGVAPSSSP
jgi:hypothetical protein